MDNSNANGGVASTPRFPDFILAGAPRCGTTAVYDVLTTHPDVYLPEKKEQWFFYADDVWAKGAEWYAEQFAAHGGAVAVGEATPLYYACDDAMKRMAAVVPDALVLLVLREPVARAVSHYWFNVRKSKEELSFEEAVVCDLDGSRPWKLARGAHNYVTLGKYDVHYERVLRYFPKDRVHVILLDDLVAEPHTVFDSLWRFLDVAPMDVDALPNSNADKWIRSRSMQSLYKDSGLKRLARTLLPERVAQFVRGLRDRVAYAERQADISEQVLDSLRAEFAPHVDRMEQMSGRSLDSWRTRGGV